MDATWKVEKPERWGGPTRVPITWLDPTHFRVELPPTPPEKKALFLIKSIFKCCHLFVCTLCSYTSLYCEKSTANKNWVFRLVRPFEVGWWNQTRSSFWLWWILQQRSSEYTLLWYKHTTYSLYFGSTPPPRIPVIISIVTFLGSGILSSTVLTTPSLSLQKERSQNSNVMPLAILCDLLRKVKWPFERLYRWPPNRGSKGHALNHLVVVFFLFLLGDD